MEGIAAYYLAPRLRQFRDRFPDIVVELVTERHLINLTKREADVSISFVPLAGPKLTTRKLGEFGLSLFGSSEYLDRKGVPDTVEALKDHDFVDYVEDLVAIPNVHWLLDIIEPPNVTFRSTSMAAQQNAIAAGQGLGLLPLFSATTNPDLIAVLPNQASARRELYLTVHQDIEFLGRVRALCRFISEQIQADEEHLCGPS
jgi:DNA-binding transcriptional LysR family regulator